MSEIDSGGMAFPVTPTDRSGQIGPTEYGLTKRERCLSIVQAVMCVEDDLLNDIGKGIVKTIKTGGQDGE